MHLDSMHFFNAMVIIKQFCTGQINIDIKGRLGIIDINTGIEI